MNNRKRKILEIFDMVLIGFGTFIALLFSSVNTVICLISVCIVILLFNFLALLIHRQI